MSGSLWTAGTLEVAISTEYAWAGFVPSATLSFVLLNQWRERRWRFKYNPFRERPSIRAASSRLPPLAASAR
jgi:hypothetical protein